MTKKDFLEARRTYVMAKACYEIAKTDADKAECAFAERRGYGYKLIWTLVDLDEVTFEKLCEEWAVECTNENEKLAKAQAVLNEAEKHFAEIAVTDVLLPASELSAFRAAINANAAVRSKIIDLAMKLDVRTMPA